MSPTWVVFLLPRLNCTEARPPDIAERQNISSRLPLLTHRLSFLQTSLSKDPPFCLPFPAIISLHPLPIRKVLQTHSRRIESSSVWLDEQLVWVFDIWICTSGMEDNRTC